MPETTSSPCTRVCCLDDQNVCLGCGRTLDEIRRWSQMSDAERVKVNELARARHAVTEQRYVQTP